MTKETLLEAINYVDATRVKRRQMADQVIRQPELIPLLLEIAFTDDPAVSSKASWVLEFALKNRLTYLCPYLDQFSEGIGKIRLDSSVRPMAKLCECLVLAFFAEKDPEVSASLTEKHLENIATACFDWLIGGHKVAPKAYSMTSLWHLGKRFSWIHPELKLVLEQNYATGSAAYKARARQILAKLRQSNS